MNGEITAGGADDAARAVTKGLQDMGDAGRAAGKDIDGGMKKAADSAKTLAQQLREVNAILRENAAGMKLESLYQVKQAPASTYQPDLSVFEKADADREAAAKAADDKAAQERADKSRKAVGDASMEEWRGQLRQVSENAEQQKQSAAANVAALGVAAAAAKIALDAFRATVEKPIEASKSLDSQDVRAAKAGANLGFSEKDVADIMHAKGSMVTPEQRVSMMERLAEVSRTRAGGMMPINRRDASTAMSVYMQTGNEGVSEAAGKPIALGDMTSAQYMSLAQRLGRPYGSQVTPNQYNRALGRNAVDAQIATGFIGDEERLRQEREAARNGRGMRQAQAAGNAALAGTLPGYLSDAVPGARPVVDALGASAGGQAFAPQPAGPSDVAQLNATIRERMPLTAPASRRGAGIEGDRR